MSTQSSEANAVVDDEYPLLLIGRDHRVSYANVRAHQLFGFEHGGLHGMSIEQLLAPSRRTEVRNVQAVLRGQAARRFRSVTRRADGALIDVNLGLEPCLDSRGSVVAVKLRCERILRSEPSAPPTSFASSSGTRPIPPRAGVPPPRPKSARPSVSPPPSARTQPATPRPSAVPPAPPLSVTPRSGPVSVPPRSTPQDSARPVARTLEAVPSARVQPSIPPTPKPSISPPPKSRRVPVVRPPAPPSELVLSEDGAEQLETALQLLGWLRQRIQAEDGPLGCPRERARVLLVLNETTELVAECRCDLKREVKPRARHA